METATYRLVAQWVKKLRHCISPLYSPNTLKCGRLGSSIGIVTDYGLDGPGIESRWGREFPPVQSGPGAQSASCTMGTGSLPGVKYGRGVTLTPHPLLALRSWKKRAISLPPRGLNWACKGVTLLYFTLHWCAEAHHMDPLFNDGLQSLLGILITIKQILLSNIYWFDCKHLDLNY
jgi:hypothetical protein